MFIDGTQLVDTYSQGTFGMDISLKNSYSQ